MFNSGNPELPPAFSSNSRSTSFPSHSSPRTSQGNIQAMRRKCPQISALFLLNGHIQEVSTALQCTILGSSCLHSSSPCASLGKYQMLACSSSCLGEWQQSCEQCTPSPGGYTSTHCKMTFHDTLSLPSSCPFFSLSYSLSFTL